MTAVFRACGSLGGWRRWIVGVGEEGGGEWGLLLSALMSPMIKALFRRGLRRFSFEVSAALCYVFLLFWFLLSLVLGRGMCDAGSTSEMNYFTPDLLRQSPSALKRCLQSQKNLKLSVKFTEWTVHAIESHVFCANNLLNLSASVLTGGRGSLINTSAFRELTVFNTSIKSCFSTSDCCFTTSFDPMCSMMVRCAAMTCRILSIKSETISFKKKKKYFCCF